MDVIYGLATAFVVTAVWIPSLISRAHVLGLVDLPGEHRHHGAATPIIGGMAMFFGILAGLFVLPAMSAACQAFLIGGGLLTIAGYLDDRRLIGTPTKALLQIGAACTLVLIGDVVIHDMGDLLGAGMIRLGWMEVPFTVFAIVGLINAMNMLDGMDGLAGGTALTICALLGTVAYLSGAYDLLSYILVAMGAVAAFLCFNARVGRPRARVFMGDTGSMLLGYALAWFVITLSQEPVGALRPMTVLWILMVPVLDTFRLMFLRTRERASPFAADNRHLHHLLAGNGWSVNAIVLLACVGTVLCSVAALHLETLHGGDTLLFYGYAVIFLGYLGACAYLSHRMSAAAEDPSSSAPTVGLSVAGAPGPLLGRLFRIAMATIGADHGRRGRW